MELKDLPGITELAGRLNRLNKLCALDWRTASLRFSGSVGISDYCFLINSLFWQPDEALRAAIKEERTTLLRRMKALGVTGKEIDELPPINEPAPQLRWDTGALRQHFRVDGVLTRNDVLWWTEAEHAITDAIKAVESMGASPALTAAVMSLTRARERVADHVEGQTPPPKWPDSGADL
jgi:hypothetical protein